MTMPSSKLKVAIAQVLKDEGYIGDVRSSEGPGTALTIALNTTRAVR